MAFCEINILSTLRGLSKKLRLLKKSIFLCDTPIPIAIGTPRGDLLKSSYLVSPPWGVGGEKALFYGPNWVKVKN